MVKKDERFKMGAKTLSLDLSLYKNGKFETFIEIKRNSRNELAQSNYKLKNQLNEYLTISNAKYAICFFDGQFFKYVDDQFIPQTDFPSPEKEKGNTSSMDFEFFREILDENIRLKEEHNKNHFDEKMLTQLGNDLYIIKTTISRMEGKLDTMLDILSNLTNEFKETKSTSLEIQEKVLKLNKQLDKSISEILENHTVSIAPYQDILEQWFSFELS